jgi:hypothetical protein
MLPFSSFLAFGTSGGAAKIDQSENPDARQVVATPAERGCEASKNAKDD